MMAIMVPLLAYLSADARIHQALALQAQPAGHEHQPSSPATSSPAAKSGLNLTQPIPAQPLPASYDEAWAPYWRPYFESYSAIASMHEQFWHAWFCAF